MKQALLLVLVVGGYGLLGAQEIEVEEENGFVYVGWETQEGVAYRLEKSSDGATWTEAESGGGWLYGAGHWISYAVHAIPPAGGGDPLELPPAPNSSHTFLVTEYEPINKVLISWGGGAAGQVLLDRSDNRLPVGELVLASVEVPEAEGFYALTTMPVGVTWQPSFVTDPALQVSGLDPDQSAELQRLFDAKGAIQGASGSPQQGASTASPGEAGIYRLVRYEIDSDSDGLPDAVEFAMGADSLHPDSDRDGFPDGVEAELGTGVLNPMSVPVMSMPGADLFLQESNVTLAGGASTLVMRLTSGGRWWELAPQTGPTTFSQSFVRGVAYEFKLRADGTGDAEVEILPLPNPPSTWRWWIEFGDGVALPLSGGGSTPLAAPVTVKTLAPVEVQIRKPQEGRWVATHELKVAKWEEAWDPDGTFRDEFIDWFIREEVDRFRIRVPVDELPVAERNFYIASTGAPDAGYDDTPTAVTLEKDVGVGANDGFISKAMILVADGADNGFKNDDAPGDQTHIAALGSTVEFRHGAPTGKSLAALPVEAKNTVDVAVSLLWQEAGGPKEESLANIAEDVKVAKEVFAQTGIQLNVTVSAEHVVQPGIDLSDGLQIDKATAPGTLTAEGQVALDAFATPGVADVVCLYVEGGVERVESINVEGIAIPDNAETEEFDPLSYWADGVSGSFKGTCLVNAARLSRATLAHELGHVLSLLHLNFEPAPNGDSSAATSRNLMTGAGTSYQENYRSDSKRLRAFQQGRICGSQFVQPAP